MWKSCDGLLSKRKGDNSLILLFDVDGTLTPSRGLMDPDFKRFFLSLPNFSLVTGSDVGKTIEQVGQDVFERADYCFNCSGSDVYRNGVSLLRNDWKPSDNLLLVLNNCLEDSLYTERYGNHIEIRPGSLNFSIVGRNAVGDQRTDYFNWDKSSGERHRLCVKIRTLFPEISAGVGGETGIDIYPKGYDKAQTLKFFPKKSIHFFGDRCEPGGNDHSIARRLKNRNNCKVSHVKNWKETWQLLQEK